MARGGTTRADVVSAADPAAPPAERGRDPPTCVVLDEVGGVRRRAGLEDLMKAAASPARLWAPRVADADEEGAAPQARAGGRTERRSRGARPGRVARPSPGSPVARRRRRPLWRPWPERRLRRGARDAGRGAAAAAKTGFLAASGAEGGGGLGPRIRGVARRATRGPQGRGGP